MNRPGNADGLHLISRVVAAVVLVVVSPVLLLAALAIKLSSSGPVFYPAARAGLSGRPFVMLKLRTMRGSPSGRQQRITAGNDSRVHPVGHWLRRLKIDELPQLANVVRGQMVLVGPRPEDPSIVTDYYTPFMLRTLTVRPGLTSPGSLDYFAGEAGLPADPAAAEQIYVGQLLPRKAALDLVYVLNRSWRYDVQLVARTLASLVHMRAVFARQRAWETAQADVLLLTASAGPPKPSGGGS